MKLPTETENLFSALRQSAKLKPMNAIEKLIHDAPDREAHFKTDVDALA